MQKSVSHAPREPSIKEEPIGNAKEEEDTEHAIKLSLQQPPTIPPLVAKNRTSLELTETPLLRDADQSGIKSITERTTNAMNSEFA